MLPSSPHGKPKQPRKVNRRYVECPKFRHKNHYLMLVGNLGGLMLAADVAIQLVDLAWISKFIHICVSRSRISADDFSTLRTLPASSSRLPVLTCKAESSCQLFLIIQCSCTLRSCFVNLLVRKRIKSRLEYQILIYEVSDCLR